MQSSEKSTRLNKFISESGLCSRREADRYIEQGNVLINGRRAKIGDRVSQRDKVLVNGNLLEAPTAEDFILIALNKPVGITSTTENNVRDNIVDFVNHSHRLFPVGRLDKDSQGLIFLTNNGDLVNKILRAGNHHEKEYLVTVNKPVTESFVAAMANGVPVLGGTTKKCFVKQESAFVFRIILIQGLNRQIRRMCEYLNYEVTKLERVRIMNVSLKGLPVGDWRELTEAETNQVLRMTENSSATGKKKLHKEEKNKNHSKSNFQRHKHNKETGGKNEKRKTGNSLSGKNKKTTAKNSFNKNARNKKEGRRNRR